VREPGRGRHRRVSFGEDHPQQAEANAVPCVPEVPDRCRSITSTSTNSRACAHVLFGYFQERTWKLLPFAFLPAISRLQNRKGGNVVASDQFRSFSPPTAT